MIKGEKVFLRAIEPEDIKEIWEWMQDEEMMKLRNYPSPPESLAEAEREYHESLVNRPKDLRLAICAQDGELIGEAWLRRIDQRAGDAEFTIVIGKKSYWGMGYGTDATRCLAGYAFDQLNLHRITLHVHDFNERAIRSYLKCGFKEEGRLREAEYMDGKYSDILIMGLLRGDFEEAGKNMKKKGAATNK